MIVAVLNNLMDLGNPSLVPFWYILFALGSLALLVIGVSRIIVGKRTNRLSIIRIGIAEIFLFAILIFILCGLYFLKWDKNLGNPSIFIWGMAVTIGLVGVLIRYGKNLYVAIHGHSKKVKRKCAVVFSYWAIIAIPVFIWGGPLDAWKELFNVF